MASPDRRAELRPLDDLAQLVIGGAVGREADADSHAKGSGDTGSPTPSRSRQRGLVRMGHNSRGSKARVQCDGLMMDPISRSDTWPDIQIQNPHVTVAHEAVVGKISDEQLFYMQSRGFSEDEAAAMIVNGFIEPVTKELPMEYAVELNRLIQLEMVGSIG
jgi:Fe-S cluster assembly protein SufB